MPAPSDSRMVVPWVAKRTFDSSGETASECGFAQPGRNPVVGSGIQVPLLIERRCPERDCMSLYINLKQIGDVAVLRCAGRMVRGGALCLVQEAVTNLPKIRFSCYRSPLPQGLRVSF